MPKGRLFQVFCAVLTIGLRLPDGVGHSPESSQYKEEVELVGIRLPEQEGDDAGEVYCRS